MSKITRQTYDIIEDGQYIYLVYRRLHITEIMTWNSLLYQIITNPCISFFYDDGRLRFQIQICSPHFTCRIHDLSYACYHGYIKSFDTWITDLQDFYDAKGELTIDHCDGNPHNNTIFNLSLMNGPLNSSKGSITSCFVLPVILKTAYVEGEYRVGVVWNGRNGAAISIYFRCSDAETFVDCLYALADASPRWYEQLRVSGWTLKNGINWAADIGHSIVAQKEFAAMPRDIFQEFKKGTQIGELTIVGMERAVLAVRREE